MKIGIEAQRIFRPAKHGMEVAAMELIRQLQQIDTVNEYIIFVKDDADRAAVQATPNFRIEYVKSLTYADWEQFALPRAIRKNRPDLVHCLSNTGPVRSPAPLALTVHDIIYLESVTFGGSAYQDLGNIYRRFITPRVMRKAELIITVSEYEKGIISDKCAIGEDRIKVVGNGVSDRFAPVSDLLQLRQFRDAYGLPPSFILFLGNTAPKKNTPNLLRAYAEYFRNDRDALPLVVTDYPRASIEKILRSANSPEAMQKIISPGYIESKAMPLLYNSAAFFVYPSLRESFGLPVLEAMACGTPVIASDSSAIPEVAGKAALLTDPNSVADLASAMYTMAHDPSLREQLIVKGQERARQFSWRESAKQLKNIYTEICAGLPRLTAAASHRHN